MAKIERPAPAERMAVFETRELPGSESIIDWAAFFGSSAGTLDANRVEVNEVVKAVRIGSAGRRRDAPFAASVQCANCHRSATRLQQSTYR